MHIKVPAPWHVAVWLFAASFCLALVQAVARFCAVYAVHAVCRFINRDDLDFATMANMAPIQEWDLQETNDGSLEYPTQ